MLVEVESRGGARTIDLLSGLDASEEERAHEDAYAWIKAVRALEVDGEPFRTRVRYRGDSLWWFAELYLHKEQAIHGAIRAIHAFDRLLANERPARLRFVRGRHPGVLRAAAAARGVPYDGPGWPHAGASIVRMEARAMRLAAAARLSRLRGAAVPTTRAPIAAFVHRAFWRAGRRDGSAESYIGPILRELETRETVRYVGVGPRTNFRARRWWDPLAGPAGDSVIAIERFAPYTAMDESQRLYRHRSDIRRALLGSAALRDHAVVRGVDCWPLVRDELAGIALLQFPWSARTMDEAAAALRALRPDVAVTYAEAGGWGRAIALEARRLGVPLAGLQHGFIYRHWLNYRHEPDEMRADPGNAEDRGFPLPSKTLLFDEHAAAHLRRVGHFPGDAIAVTGSARLDELLAAVRALTPDAVARVRRDTGAGDRPLVVFAAKEREARGALPALVAAVRARPQVQLAIKPHPAETPEVYAGAAGGVDNIRVLGADAPLPPLLAAAAGLVTVNSTVAIDALALGLPSLVIGLPNNLSPFVAAGTMLGARGAEEIGEGLTRLLYDQKFRSALERKRADGTGRAAAAAADAILALRS